MYQELLKELMINDLLYIYPIIFLCVHNDVYNQLFTYLYRRIANVSFLEPSALPPMSNLEPRSDISN